MLVSWNSAKGSLSSLQSPFTSEAGFTIEAMRRVGGEHVFACARYYTTPCHSRSDAVCTVKMALVGELQV